MQVMKLLMVMNNFMNHYFHLLMLNVNVKLKIVMYLVWNI
ncbi:unnamed protein product [Onchocerca flexuosa]|uniref:Uncharacterized protein n=1 Tax=Onchocerca flexuosa TaxID=387005 RepID=A0A183HWX8_9BILA|nr:unnamed protein product [Onchocerca flexuosa]